MDKKRILKYFLFYVFTIVSAVVAVILYIKYFPIESKIITEKINKTELSETAIEESIQNVYDAVVTVRSYQNEQLIGTGSGFVYKKDDKKGYILTNTHVISSSDSVNVVLQNGESVDAKLLGADEYSDVAVLSIDASKVLKVASLGDSDSVKVGSTVFTVGSPMGENYSGSITKGIISAKDRTIETDDVATKVLQTDAAINPGNSGGPLVNLAGEVIGITSMKLAQEEIEGMGFAIPINDAKVYVKNLEKGEKISRPVLGVSLINVTDRYRLYYYRINVDSSIDSGVVVAGVEKDSAASKAGLEKGDVIIKIDNTDITSISNLRYNLYKYKVDDEIQITYIRNNKQNKVKLKLMGN